MTGQTRSRQDQINAANNARAARERDLSIPDVADADRRQQLEADDAAWLSAYLPDIFFNPFTDDQLEMIADVGESLRYGTKKSKAAERGGGKTSIVKSLMLKYALQRLVMFPMVIAATHGKAKKTTESLRHRLASKAMTSAEIAELGARGGDTSDLRPNLLAEDYPVECFTARYVNPWPSRAKNVTANGQRPIHVKWGSGDGYFILPTFEDQEPIGPIVMSIGWSSDELQGCNILDRRPDFILLDDLDSRDSIASEDGGIAAKIETAIETTIAGLAGPDGKLGQYFLGTCAGVDAAIYTFTDRQKKPAWSGKRVPSIQVWPKRMDMWENYMHLRQKNMQEGDPHARSAHQFYLDHREEMDDGAETSNQYRFKSTELPDGTQDQASNLQFCFNYIADNSREAFDTEYQQDPPKKDAVLEARVTGYHVGECASEFQRKEVDPTTSIVVRGVDVRKIELHSAALAVEPTLNNRICDYDLDVHGSSETTVEQAEGLILDALRWLGDAWAADPMHDINGIHHETDLVLIDKGWVGNWTEDGIEKTWATQPVETFCMEQEGKERRLRRFLPCKGSGRYKRPKPDRAVNIVGDNWHINLGPGAERLCDEVIWNATHWHLLVEELFMLADDDADKFVLFESTDSGIWLNHKAFGQHMEVGASELKKQLSKATRSRRPRFVRDHWWDCMAQCLVAKSIEHHFRQLAARKKPRRSLQAMAERAKG